jgi:hypothetical protein
MVICTLHVNLSYSDLSHPDLNSLDVSFGQSQSNAITNGGSDEEVRSYCGDMSTEWLTLPLFCSSTPTP